MSQIHFVRSIAKTFVNSKLTPIIIILSIFLGVLAIIYLPREEEPQIIVPMADVFIGMPGASPKEVQTRIIRPVEKLLQEIPGVEYIYSTAMPGKAMIVVRFYVGENLEDSLVKLYNKLYSNFDKIPPGISKPIIKPKSIDDVPILTLALWGKNYDGSQLRKIASQLCESIKKVSDVSETSLIGGYREFMKINLLPSKMSNYKVDAYDIMQAIKESDQSAYLDTLNLDGENVSLKFEGSLKTKEDLEKVVVKVIQRNIVVFLKDVANIELAPEEVNSYVMYKDKKSGIVPAVTISIAKQKGKNATVVAENIIKKLKTVRKEFVPGDVHISITRNLGETAAERSNELLVHMFIAIFSVTVLIWLALGKKESLVVALSIPTTLALTLSTFVLYGFTLNRVTFFALIFSIGILVDDAIVVVENVVRHIKMTSNKDKDLTDVVVEATDEVGNPTILATMTVIFAILPMAFVGGLMGPYMRPIPIGASSAMFFSMLIAFIVIPWATVRILGTGYLKYAQKKHSEDDWLTKNYKNTMDKLVRNPRYRKMFLSGILVLLILASSLVIFKFVRVKMLPFDNKNEFQVVIDTKEGTTLQSTYALAKEIADYLLEVKEVVNYQIYTGLASPFNFNGLVRHYYLRQGDNVADIQVNLLPKDQRSRQSHDIAKSVRPKIQEIAKKYDASVKIAEVPPGPPVLQTLVAEVYGPDYTRQIEIAEKIKIIFQENPSVVDVDWYMEDPSTELAMIIDREKAQKSGLSVEKVSKTLEITSSGMAVSLLHSDDANEEIPIWLQMPDYLKSGIHALLSTRLVNRFGDLIPLDTIVNLNKVTAPRSIYHKNLKPVVYITADVSGALESPVYAIMELYKAIDDIELPEGYKMHQYFTQQPFLLNKYSMKWDGEWQITYEVFRDLGIAFAVVLLLIYALIVGWFKSFKTPLIIMSAIPFSLVGILPAHMFMGAFFTATSMIGFIAGAGIVVRNSIILVDFIELRVSEGMSLSESVVDAGAVRFKPMMLTAAAVVVGSAVILFDPIFQGLAISLMAGEVASLFLSRSTVPILYYLWNVKHYLNSKIIVDDDESINLIDNSYYMTGN